MQEHMKKKKVEILKFMEEKGISLEDYKVITSELWYYDDLSFFLLFDAYINQQNSPCVGALLNLTVSCLLHWNCNRKCCSDACQGSYSQTRLL